MSCHGEKIVDGIPIKYICQPCPECEAKLQAAEEIMQMLWRAETWNVWQIIYRAQEAWGQMAGNGGKK